MCCVFGYVLFLAPVLLMRFSRNAINWTSAKLFSRTYLKTPEPANRWRLGGTVTTGGK